MNDPREQLPHGVATSPPLSPFHPQPPEVQLRQRPSPAHPRTMDVLRVHIQTPYADHGAPSLAWDAPHAMTVAEAKDAIASGTAGYGLWEREGLRLVWRGRILRDEDKLGSVLTDPEPTLHLVARPITPSQSRGTLTANQSTFPAHSTASTTALHSRPTTVLPGHSTVRGASADPVPAHAAPPPNTSITALADCVHYLLFAAREHLCSLIGAETIAWEDMHPAPTVSRDVAKAAVISVIRPYAASAGWEGWEGAFISSWSALEDLWRTLGRDAVTREISTLWKTSTGRDFGPSGEAADVELDHATFSLNLPPLSDMAPSQLVQLLQYLRVTTLLRPICAQLSSAQAQAASIGSAPPLSASPAATQPGQAALPIGITIRAVRRAPPLFQIPALPRISFVLVQHQFWSAARLATIVWMLTRSMGWADTRLWLMAGAAFGWWVVDGYNQWMNETREARVRARRAQRRAEAQERLANPDEARARLDAIARGEAPAPSPEVPVGQEEENPLDAGLMAAENLGSATARQLNAALPFLHLDVDAAQLRLPSSTSEPQDAGRGRTAGGRPAPPPPAGSTLGPVPYSHPSIIVTNFLLPIYLWVLTLVPAFEARRARAIRGRERTMRSLVAGLNPPSAQQRAALGGEEAEERPQMLPDGLSRAARRYYCRVTSKPEAIDWDEEREAQRAMGIPDEQEEGAGIALL